MSLPPPSPPPPSPPPPSTDPFAIPETGVQILHGGKENAVKLACFYPGDESKFKAPFPNSQGALQKVAAQCCRTDETTPKKACTRFIGAPDQDGCIGGKKPLLEMTYSKAAAKCAALSEPNDPDIGPLALCPFSCAFEGCEYNTKPVYSSLPCNPE